MKRIIILALVSLITLGVSAQQSKSASKKDQTVTIQTNGVCQKCADKFKENVPYFKGVKDYTYDMKTAKLTITYDASRTNPDQLRQQISKLGYNADNVKADAAARAKLPACCRVEKSQSGCGGCAGHGSAQGCGNHADGKSCGNHADGKSCGNHADGKSCGNHADGKSCGNHADGKSCGNHGSEHKCSHGDGKSCGNHNADQKNADVKKDASAKKSTTTK